MTQTNQGTWPPSRGALGWEGGGGAGQGRELKSQVLCGGKQDQQKEPSTISSPHRRAVGTSEDRQPIHQHERKPHSSPVR